MNKIFHFTIILFFFTTKYAFGNKIFVSPNGSNSNKGTINLPYKSIQFAVDQSKDFDTIYLRNGIYFEAITIISKHNLTITHYQNEIVTISPFIPNINLNWEKYSENIYKTKLSDTVLQIFLDNIPLMQAAFPNMNEELFNIQNAVNIAVSSDKTINFPGITKFGNINSGYFLGLCSDNIVSIGGKITSSSGNQLTIADSAFYWRSDFENNYLGKGKGYLIGNLAFLDTPGEWFSDGTFLYYYPNNISDLNAISIRNKKFSFLINNSSNVNLSMFNIFGGSILVNESTNCTITNLNIEYPVPFHHPWSGFERFSQYWTGSEVLTRGPETWTGKGVEISGKNNQLSNCYIAHSWGDGATIYGIENKIENCIIEDCDWIANDCSVLNVSGYNHIIKNNTFRNSARSIIVNRKLEKSYIQNNEIAYGGKICTDLGLIYCYDTDGKNTEISYNYIHDNFAKKNGVGIYLDENNQNHSINHNIISNCFAGININKPSKNTIVYNNTLYKNEFSMGTWGNTGELLNVYTFNNLTDTDKKLTWNYDAFYGTSLDSNYLYTNPIFIDPINNNFELKPNSFPINTGIKNEYTTNYFGNLPDKGALEYGLSPWKYGSTIILQNKIKENPYPCTNLTLIKNTIDSTFLTWEYIHGQIDSFYVERKLSSEQTYSIIARLDSTIFSYNDPNLTLGEYRYQIRAKNEFGISEPSNSVEVFKNNTDKKVQFLDAENNDLQVGTIITDETLTYIDNKDWIAFKQVDFGDSLFDAVQVRMAVPCEYANQRIQMRVDSYMGKIIGEYFTENTGGWDTFENKNFPIDKISGKHDLYIKFKGKYGIGTIDWFKLFNSQGTVVKSIYNDPSCPKSSLISDEIPVKLFPNPGDKLLRVSFDNNEISSAKVEVFNTIGHKISEQNFSNLYPGEIELYVETDNIELDLKSSFYIVKVSINNQYHTQETILKYIRL
jgi:hypothetical protein